MHYVMCPLTLGAKYFIEIWVKFNSFNCLFINIHYSAIHVLSYEYE